MSFTSLILVLCTPAVILLIRTIFIPAMSFRIPGPLLLKFTRIPLALAEVSGSRDSYITALHRSHGPIVQVAPRHVSVNDIVGVRQLSAVSKRLDRSIPLPFFHNYESENLVSTVDGTVHYERRKPLRTIYTAKAAESPELTEVIMSTAQSFVDLAKADTKVHGKAEAKRLLHFATLDIMSFVMYGAENRAYTLLDAEQRAAWEPDIEFQEKRILSASAAFMFLCPNLTLWLRRWGLAPKSIAGSYLQGNSSDQIGRRAWKNLESRYSDQDPGYESLMHRFYTHFEANGPSVAIPSIEYILSDCLDHFWAGITTTTDAMAPLLRHLSKPENLERQRRLKREVLESAAEAGVPVASLSAEQLKRLPFLNAVIRETLRLHPPIPFNMERRVTDKQGILVHEYAIPSGWQVSAPAMAMQNSEDVFEDPTTWTPERWLDDRLKIDPEARRTQERNMKAHFFAFGSGPRMCLGLNVAYSTMRGLVAGIYGSVETEIDETSAQG